jgi:putative aldouronate transport system substrate-binding protein
MKMKNGKIMTAVILVLLAAGSGWAAGGRQAAEGSDEVVTITQFPLTNFTPRAFERSTWFTDMLAKDLKLRMNFVEYTNLAEQSQLFQNMLMSRQMPDLVFSIDKTLVQQGIAAGLFIDLDKYKDKLPNLYNAPGLQSMIKYHRNTFGVNGEGLYAVSMMVGKNKTVNFVPTIRWDLYEKLGSPKIATFEDLIPLLKRMMEINPVSESGHKTYGVVIFPEWDIASMAFATYPGGSYGGGDHTSLFELTGDSYTGNIISRLDDSSRYKRAVKWFFLANQAGILDPDSINETYATVQQKNGDGRGMFSFFEWMTGSYNTKERIGAAEPKGFMPILAEDMKPIIQPDSPIGGTGGRLIMIGAGKDPKKIDAALRYLNYLCSWDFITLHNNGPEGLLWERRSDGKVYVTDRAWQIWDNNLDVPELSNTKTSTLYDLQNADMYNEGEINPVTGYPLSQFVDWPDYILRNNTGNNLWKKWSAANGGALNLHDLITGKGISTKTPGTVYFMPSLPADMESLQNQVGDVIKTDSWRAVYAKNEAEFEALWKDMQQKTKTLGMDRLLDWYKTAWANASAEAAQYR